jgi:hypothetical protein
MDPLSEKRHRLHKHEVPEVVEGLKLRLETLLKTQTDQERAETAFRILFRLLDEGKGRPRYPEFSWDVLQYYLDYWPAFSPEKLTKLAIRERDGV